MDLNGAEHFRSIPDGDSRRSFSYGDALTVKSNGIYTVYVKDPTGKETLVNVNVSKIDDIPPKYSFDNSTGENILVARDDETGVKSVMFKKFSDFNNNLDEVYANSGDVRRSSVEYYLMDGKGKDALYELENEISAYVTEMKNILLQKQTEENDFNRWITENPVDGIYVTNADLIRVQVTHDIASKEFDQQINELNNKYPYLKDLDALTPFGRLVVYIEDYSGNSVIAGTGDEIISTRMLANSYNISLQPLVDLIDTH